MEIDAGDLVVFPHRLELHLGRYRVRRYAVWPYGGAPRLDGSATANCALPWLGGGLLEWPLLRMLGSARFGR
jgi:hypothetical protein